MLICMEPNKFLLIMRTWVWPEKMLFFSGEDTSLWPLLPPHLISTSMLRLDWPLGASHLPSFIGSWKERSLWPCPFSTDSTERSHRWKWPILKLTMPRTSKQEWEPWWPMLEAKSNSSPSMEIIFQWGITLFWAYLMFYSQFLINEQIALKNHLYERAQNILKQA